MQPINYARHQFPADIIQHAVWLYLRFTLSYCYVEEFLAQRGIEISYEAVRRCGLNRPNTPTFVTSLWFA
jgi:putative transposase